MTPISYHKFAVWGREGYADRIMNALTSVLLCIVLLGVILVLAGCSREIREANLFHPQRVGEVPGEPGRRDLEIPIDDTQALRGWYFYDASRGTTLIYFYGNGETTHTSYRRARWLVGELGVNVMLIDYRGYGYSDGTPGIDALLEDSLRIYDGVAMAGAPPQRIMVFGRSIGTAPAIHLATHRDVCALILEAPFTTITDVIAAWDRNLGGPVGWVVRLRPEKRLAEMHPQPLDLMAEMELPLLVIHGDRDTVIPTALGRRMFQAAPDGNKTWVEVRGAGHNDLPLTHPDVVSAIRKFAEIHVK